MSIEKIRGCLSTQAPVVYQTGTNTRRPLPVAFRNRWHGEHNGMSGDTIGTIAFFTVTGTLLVWLIIIFMRATK
ncbi:hypothetical protein [Paeniglutamicibacter kerguelensis]